MVKKHLFRISAPRFWEIERKTNKYTFHPTPGPHSINNSIPLILLVRDYLKLADTSREAKKIINTGLIEVDNFARKNYRFPVGLMDVISIKSLDKHYRVLKDENGKIILHNITKDESTIKPLKIIDKKIIRKKKIQLNFYDGKNKLVEKDLYKTSDALIYDLIKKSFIDHLKFEKGSIIYLTDGKNIGQVGILETIKDQKANEPTKIVLKQGKHKFETLKKFAFVLGKEKLSISMPKENEQSE